MVLPHEHMLLNFEGAVRKPEYGPDNMADLSLEVKNLGKIRQFPYVHVDYRRSEIVVVRMDCNASISNCDILPNFHFHEESFC